MNIIFINRLFYPDHSATSQMLSDLAFALVAKGPAVQIIASRLTYEGDRALPFHEAVRGVAVTRVPTTAFGREKLLGRTLDYFTFYISAGFQLALDAQRSDVIIAKTDPPMLGVLVVPMARVKGARAINWLQDLFPEVAAVLGIGRAKTQKWAISLLRRLRDLPLRHADANVVLGEHMAARLRRRRVPDARITTIIGEHAQEHMGAHAPRQAMVDGADVEVHGFHGAKRALDVSEAFVGGDNGGRIEPVGGVVGPQHIKAVKRGLLLDRGFVAGEGEGGVGDGQFEVLGHLAPAKHGAGLQADFLGAPQGLALTGQLLYAWLYPILQNEPNVR